MPATTFPSSRSALRSSFQHQQTEHAQELKQTVHPVSAHAPAVAWRASKAQVADCLFPSRSCLVLLVDFLALIAAMLLAPVVFLSQQTERALLFGSALSCWTATRVCSDRTANR